MEVALHVYDLSRGLARGMSQSVLGIHVDAVYHTGVLAFGKEYFYGGGIQRMDHDAVVQSFGLAPVEKISLGTTTKTQEEFHEFLESINGDFTPERYDLFHNNCNNFSDAAAKFLLGDDHGVPAHILELPSRVLNTPLGQMIAPMYQGMQQQMQEHMIPFNQPTTAASNMRSAPASAPAPEPAPAAPASGGNGLALGAAEEEAEASAAATEGIVIRVKMSTQEAIVEPKIRSMDASVAELKRALARVSDYAAEDQRLIYKGQFLKDNDKTLAAYGVAKDDVVHMVPKPGSGKSGAANAGAETSSSAAAAKDPLQAGLDRLAQAPAKDRQVALKTLQKIVLNVIDHPLEPKYRKIKRGNKALAKRLAPDGALDCLLALGFKEDVDAESGEELLVLEATQEAWQKVLEGNEKLSALLSQAPSSDATPQAQPSAAAGGAGMPFGGLFGNGGGGGGGGFPTAPGGGGFGGMDNPMANQMFQTIMSNPDMLRSMAQMPHIQQMAQSNPMMAHALREMQENPERVQNLMNSPGVQAMMQNPELARSMMGSMPGMNMFGSPGGGNTTGNAPGSNGQQQQQQNDSQMTEEEMIEEAIRRSLQEQ